MINYNNLYYKVYPYVERYVTTNGGTEEDAKDVFQDGIIVLMLKDDNEYNCSHITLLYGICKKLWLRNLKNKKTNIPVNSLFISTNNNHLFTYNTAFESKSKYNNNMELITIIKKHISNFCESDNKMFNMYLNNKSYKEIACTMNVKPSYVRKRICMCKSKLSTLLKYNPYFKKFFL
ncbi:MAG: sigma-70 family RNA polymerase sigma factor [Bacteroidales bacterium]|jgi:RNA polymerase sigma factor (sigma-70 family)